MARNDNSDRIPVVGHSDGAKTLWSPDGPGNVSIGARLAIGNIQQGVPTGKLKIRTAQIKIKVELAPLPGEILFQFPDVGLECRNGLFKLDLAVLIPQVPGIGPDRLLPGKPLVELQRDQAAAGRGQE